MVCTEDALWQQQFCTAQAMSQPISTQCKYITWWMLKRATLSYSHLFRVFLKNNSAPFQSLLFPLNQFCPYPSSPLFPPNQSPFVSPKSVLSLPQFPHNQLCCYSSSFLFPHNQLCPYPSSPSFPHNQFCLYPSSPLFSTNQFPFVSPKSVLSLP